MRKQDIYLSIDVETDGLCPGVNSMLSLGAVMLNESGSELGEFSENLERLPFPAMSDLGTMKWWLSQPEAYEQARSNPKPPREVMQNFRNWIESFADRVTVIGYPVTFDFNFVWWYLWTFTGGVPFTHGALDIKTMAAVALGVPYSQAQKRNWPDRWFPPDNKHTHVGVEDAKEQAFSFLRIREEMANAAEILHNK